MQHEASDKEADLTGFFDTHTLCILHCSAHLLTNSMRPGTSQHKERLLHCAIQGMPLPLPVNECVCAVLALEVHIAVIEEDHPDLAPVVLIHHASSCVDEVLHCKARARGYPSVRVGRDGYGEPRLHHRFSPGRNAGVLSAAEHTAHTDVSSERADLSSRLGNAHVRFWSLDQEISRIMMHWPASCSL